MYSFLASIFPLTRSLSGTGVRQTLDLIDKEIADTGYAFTRHEIPSGTAVFDWTVPKEWVIRDAYIADASGQKIIDMHVHNLHVMGYSAPVDRTVSLAELKDYVYVEEKQPDVIPYVTSYYKERYGFCMSKHQLDTLPEGDYRMVVDAAFKDGSMTLADLVIPGETDEEILFSSYVCHPSMADNECSGPALMTALIRYTASMQNRRYTYRFVLGPETIGAIAYLSQHLDHLKAHLRAGFVLTCVGDTKAYSMIASKYGETLADKVLHSVLSSRKNYTHFSFLKRGSDERQYNAAGVNLPVVSFSRSRPGDFPEYHTSADDLDFVSEDGLQGAYDAMTEVIDALEYNRIYRMTVTCEPQLSKRGLYPTVSRKGIYDEVAVMTAFIAYADGLHDLLFISSIIDTPVRELIPVINRLKEHDLLEVVS